MVYSSCVSDKYNRDTKRHADISKKMNLTVESRKNNIFMFLSLISLFIVIRLAVLFSYTDRLYETEELYHGTITHEIITGSVMPLWEYLDYKVEYFPGGSLTAGILAVPFFLILGHTYVALKLVGLTFALGTFILWFIFLKEFFNKKIAIIAGLLFIFCMPFYTKTSLITWGSHPEANFFTILSFFIFYRIFFDKSGPVEKEISGLYRHKGMHFFYLGLVAGFGLWFIQTYMLTILFLSLCWFILDKGILLRRAFYIFAIGFLLGISPLLYYGLLYKAPVLDVNGRLFLADFIPIHPGYFLVKFLKLFVLSLPNSFLFNNFSFIPGQVLSYLYYFIFLGGFIYLLWVNRKYLFICLKSLLYPVTLKGERVLPSAISKETFLLIYPLLFFIGYSLSKYSVSSVRWANPGDWLDYIGYRYMVPVIPFVLVVIAIWLDKIRNRQMLRGILFSLALILGAIGNLGLISLNNFGRFVRDKGYSYNVIADKIAFRGPENLREYIKPFLNKLDRYERLDFYDGIGSGIAWRLNDEDPDEVIKAFEKDIDKEYWPYLYKGWGSLFSLEIAEEFERAMHVEGRIPQEYRRYFYEGFGVGMSFDDIRQAIKIINRISPDYRLYCYIGLGEKLGFEYKNDQQALRGVLRNIDSNYRQYVLDGIAEGIRGR
jgi:hypothetical protein